MTPETRRELRLHAVDVREGILTAVYSAQSGHPGGSLSAADLYTYLYFSELRIDPNDPKNPNRDRFVLSKGHCSPALYAALALRGFFPEEELTTLRQIGSRLQGHPNMNETPGVEMSTGTSSMEAMDVADVPIIWFIASDAADRCSSLTSPSVWVPSPPIIRSVIQRTSGSFNMKTLFPSSPLI